MSRIAFRVGLLCAAVVVPAAPAAAQSFTINYDFGIDPFYTTERRGAITAAGQYILSQLDGRGTMTIEFDSANFGGINPLAQAGSSYLIQPGTFNNGLVFRRATTGSSPFPSDPDGFATFNTNASITWFTNSTLPVTGGQIDLQSVALHELSHTLGFASLINTANGRGLMNTSPDTYSRLDNLLRLGNGANAPRLINTNGTFNSAQVTLADLVGNNIYFHGEMAMAANGGQPVRMAGGGDLSHLHSSVANGVMLPAIGGGISRRTFHPVELAMLIDFGWNQFVWKNNTGTWGTNVSSSLGSQWANLDNLDTLSPRGTVTPNLVLRFAGSGGYTSTNDLNLTGNGDRFLVNRVVLSATGGTSTIAASSANALRFDTTIGIMPLIRQDGAGGFNITHPIELTAVNLQLGGDGNGMVALNGEISSAGIGGLTKIGASTFELGGTTANTYTGTTTVNAGVLQLNKTPGVNAIAGNVAINSGGTLRLAADDQIQGDGTGGTKVTLSGGTLSTGTTTGFSDIVGSFEMTASSTIALGTGTHTLQFTGITGAPTGTLTVTGYSAGPGGIILFSNIGTNPNSDPNFENLLATTNFVGIGTGASFFDQGGGVFTLAPVPEPATVLGLASATFGFGAMIRRRFRRAQALVGAEAQLSA